MEVIGKDEWKVEATGERVERTRAENPQNMTTGCRQFNWEELHFREWVLRWEDVCTDTAIVYYCDDPKEFSHSLTLRNKKEGTSVYVENSITNYREPEKSMAEQTDNAIQPFLDALLGACGIAPSVLMNPILLKPTTDMGSQVIVRGVPVGNMEAREYFRQERTQTYVT